MATKGKFIALICIVGILSACHFSQPTLRTLNTVDGARVNSYVQSPLQVGTDTLDLRWNQNGTPGRLAIAEIITYSGSATAVNAPEGWRLIRDDISPTTRQTLYWRVIQSCDPNIQRWTFSRRVTAQGLMLVIDGFDAKKPIDSDSGNVGNGFTLTANSMRTNRDGDLILAFFSTDFRGSSPGHDVPHNMSVIVDQDKDGATHEYWLLGAYQESRGWTGDIICKAAQVFSWAAAQVAIRRHAAG